MPKTNISDIFARLTAAKLMIRCTSDAMPTMARELRREACETIDDVIGDLETNLKKGN